MNICILIPVYNHSKFISETVSNLLHFNLPCILVDDGSDSICANELKALSNKYLQISLLVRKVNGGKGAAVKTGMNFAASNGFSHILQIDADSQHDIQDIPVFIKQAHQSPNAIITGTAVFNTNVPLLRYYSRYLTHIWVWINTLSFDIKDAMCGFRIYPLAPVLSLIKEQFTGNHMEFDIEIIVKSYWNNIRIINIPTKVDYPDDGISHFKLIRDNVRITWMHTRLFLGMVYRMPRLLFNNIKR